MRFSYPPPCTSRCTYTPGKWTSSGEMEPPGSAHATLAAYFDPVSFAAASAGTYFFL